MKLIIGGAFQGKKEYVKTRFGIKEQQMKDGADAAYEDIFQAPCLYHFHEWVKKALKENWDLENLEEKLMERNPGILVISNELGYGVVPVEAFDRKYRECTGRLCTALAKKSDEVIRVVCGIGMVIKNG
ncbi:MAG: bifunctional adenosylcobinamide kinase/adenosylcobinamide-phosphate guanylyltransferase [Blautia sp.]|mgnify:FL=1|jgi:adenosylcobinamide kinase/adenosylcobinamide-phosphate guanylyltransferase